MVADAQRSSQCMAFTSGRTSRNQSPSWPPAKGTHLLTSGQAGPGWASVLSQKP